MIRRTFRLALAVIAAAILGPAGATAVGAVEDAPAAPSVVVDRREVVPGDRLIVHLRGFSSSTATIAICGNLARRGSADCHLQGSRTDRIESAPQVTRVDLVVSAPPVPCPCVVRASSTSQDEQATTSVQVAGHPSGPVVGTDPRPLVRTELEVERAPASILTSLRAALGGPTRYRVTVRVRNTTSEPLTGIVVDAAAAHRLTDDAAPGLVLGSTGPIGPGGLWAKVVDTELRPPVAGRYVWSVRTAGAGPVSRASAVTDIRPAGLVLLLALLLFDIAVIAGRRSLLRQRRRSAYVSSAHGSNAGGERRIIAVPRVKPSRS